MKYFKVPITNGVLDIDYRDMIEGINHNDYEAYVRLKDGVEVKDTWTAIAEDEFLAAFNAARLTVDKTKILADGEDTAVIRAENPKLSEVTFIEVNLGQTIQTSPVDPSKGAAILRVSATTPGVIRIRVGLPLLSRVNEIEVIVVEG